MAQKSNASPDSMATSLLAQLPPQLSLDNHLLGSVIQLPPNPLIVYAVFTPIASTHDTHCIELARRKVLSLSHSSIIDSVLPSVHISRNVSSIYVFAIGSTNHISDSHAALNDLSLEGLIVSESSSFTPQGVYPCSLECSNQREPCPACLDPTHNTSATPESSHRTLPSAARLFPRKPLRDVHPQFLQAVRDRLIDDIAEASKKRRNGRPIKRLRRGFLLGPSHNTSEWGSGWEHHAQSRPLIHCHLQIHLSHTRLFIRPLLNSTPFHPLSFYLPVPPGTPIVLLPYGTPAYYLTTYSGPTSVLTTQFEESLVGLGMGDWISSPPYTKSFGGTGATSSCFAQKSPTYIIAWISVQNKQGEDKGITIIWPARLCLSFHPAASCPRQPLPYIPELPTQLQPSPPAVPISTISSHPAMPAEDELVALPPSQLPVQPRLIWKPKGICASPTGRSLRAFRTLAITKPMDVDDIALEVGGYVDNVAKDREKERERIRKERESAQQSPSRSAATPKAGVSSHLTPGPGNGSTPGSEIWSGHIANAAAQGRAVDIIPTAIVDQLPAALDSEFSSSPSATAASVLPPDVPISTPPRVLDMPSAIASEAAAPVKSSLISPDPTLQSSTSTAFDPFATFDAPWTQPSNDYMSFNMGYDDMGFGMNIDSMGGSSGGGGRTDQTGLDYEDGYGVFTDDDFSFFDRPSTDTNNPQSMAASVLVSSVSHESPVILGTGLTPAAGPAPLGLSSPLYDDGMHLFGPGPPSTTPGRNQSSPWVPSILAEGFTPRFIEHHASDSLPPPPELDPSSPTRSPSTYSDPATPGVQLSNEEGSSKFKMTLGVPTVFDPIPFAPAHRLMDGKYAMGKFALLSPSIDRLDSPSSPYLDSRPSGWRFSYDAATDPRVSVVRQLIGVKRKSFDQGVRDVKVSPSWVQEYQEWGSSVVQDAEGNRSDPESEDEEPWLDEDDVYMASRPSTPPPPYLPLGPTLLHTHFHHSQLLSISSSLRPPGAAIAPTLMPAVAPLSVPTPVSPAAVLGAAAEKSKSLEAAALMLAKELVENCVWARIWRMNFTSGTIEQKHVTDIWPADFRSVVQLFNDTEACPGSLQMKDLLDSGDSEPTTDSSVFLSFRPPMLSVSKSDAIIQVHPTALRFWEKLGLGPRGGKKDATTFVFFEEEGEEKASQVERWLSKVSSVYAAKNMGTHTPGQSPGCLIDGLVPVKLESIRKALGTFVANLDISAQENIVFYVVTPSAVMTLASPILRQIFSAVKRTVKVRSEAQIVFHLVPEQIVLGTIDEPSGCCSLLEPLAVSVHDRILSPVDRSMSRSFFDSNEPIRSYFQEPAFVISRPLRTQARFVRELRSRALDVMDCHTLLHIGYKFTPCGKWLVAVCIDQRGEAHDVGVWLCQGESKEQSMVTQIWSFACHTARKANVEWKIIFTKLGFVGEKELQAWVTHLEAVVPTYSDSFPIHVTLVAAEQEASWAFLAPQRNPDPPTSLHRILSKDNPGSIYVDVSSATYGLFHLNSPSMFPYFQTSSNIGLEPSYIPDNQEECPPDESGLTPHLTSTLIHVPAGMDYPSIRMLHIHLLHSTSSINSSMTIPDKETLNDVTFNFHALTILAQARQHLETGSILPFHLAALENIYLPADVGSLTE